MKAQRRLLLRVGRFYLYCSQNMRIYLTKIAKEESKTNVCAGCCVHVVDLSKANTRFTSSLDI